jgi:putative ABC transport system permease protein
MCGRRLHEVHRVGGGAMSEDRLLAIAERWCRALLRLYPSDFRDEMGDGLVETYRDQARGGVRKRGTTAWMGVLMRALGDAVRNGPGERAQPAAAWRRGGNWGRDMELSMRRLVRSPVFSLMMLGTLTVGLGAFAVVYTVVHRVLIAPLPYERPEDLYMVWRDYTWVPFRGGWAAGPDIAALQQAGGVIENAAGLWRGRTTLSLDGGGEPFEAALMTTTPNLFDLLGVRPILGRTFAPDETGPGRPALTVLTYELWQRLGGDPAILGTEVRMNGTPFTVIGVMGRDFRFVRNASLGAAQHADLYTSFLGVMAELSPGSGSYGALIRARAGTSEQAVEEAVAAVGRMVDERDFDSRGLALYPVNLKADLIAPVRQALVVLGLAAVFLVLVLLVNLGTLLLARAAAREQEFAVSRALGANRVALVRATLLEGGLLGMAGGACGALLAVWGTRLLVSMAPLDLPRREAITMTWSTGATVIGVGALLGLLAAALPATWAVRSPLSSLLGSMRMRGGGSSGRMRRGMVVVQVALSLVLLTAGALVVRSFDQLLRAQPGFDPTGVLTLRVPVPQQRYTEFEAANELHERLHAALAALPGVTAAGAAGGLPLGAGMNQTWITLPGAPGNTGVEEHDVPMIDYTWVRPGYFEAMGIRVVAGEAFTDMGSGANEAVVDRQLAMTFFPDGTAVGGTLALQGDTLRIIGVVEHARAYDIHRDDRPQVYLRNNSLWSLSWVLRTNRSPAALANEVRSVVRSIDPELAVAELRPMADIADQSLSQQRITAVLVAGFALGALLLAGMGLFGVVSGSVTRRRHELAVRLALGADHRRLIGMVMAEGAVLVLLGALIGVPGVYAAGRAISGTLVGVSASDPLTLLLVALGLGVVAMAACFIPARRVVKIAPGQALRQE